MSGCSMALRYDDRGSSFSKPYYNGKSGGNTGNGKDRSWSNSNSNDGGGRYGKDIRETATSSDYHARKYDRKENSSTSKAHENWDDRSNAEDSDKTTLKQVGDWTEQLSSAGKKYYYNCRTEVSQWEKPSEWVAWEKRNGTLENRKKRPDRSTADDQISPSHSSAGRPSSSRDQSQCAPKRSGHEESAGAYYENAGGRNYGSQSRRPYPNNSGISDRQNDYPRSSRSKYDARGGNISSSRLPYDGQQSRYDQPPYASTSADRGTVDARDRSKRSAPSTSRDLEIDDTVRERSPKRSRITPSEHGNEDKDGPETEKETRDESDVAMECDDDTTTDVQIDMDRLPHLLVEIAEKHNIDLSDPDALEKIKLHLRTALCKELNGESLTKNGETISNHLAAVSDDDEEASVKVEVQEQYQAPAIEDKNDLVHESDQIQATESAEAAVHSSMAELYNEELITHIRGWSAEHFEVQAASLATASFRTSLNVSHVAADLKCARSLVRTAEIRSTLLEQRIAYLRQQYHELETMSKPNAAALASASS